MGGAVTVEKRNSAAFVLFAGGAAFCAYFSMYAFRKPFTAATYATVGDWSFAVDFKIALVIAQVAGYALSKVIGVKIVSEMERRRRGVAIISLIGVSWLALVVFALVPGEWKVAALFFNGLPLGLIWGLVFAYLEGRRTTDILGAILCASFIVSSGMVKSVGVWLMNAFGASEFWMPAATGAIFAPLLLLSVFGLSQLPPPDASDIAARTKRGPMDASSRGAFLAAYGPGVWLLVVAYVLFTVIRDFRDNFAAEIWTDLGFGGVSSVFTASEAPIAVMTLLMLGALVAIRDNVRALIVIHAVVLLGAVAVAASTIAFQMGLMTPLTWMIASGAGLYFAYTPFNAMLFDRLLAAARHVGTAGFLIYVADASGYVGSVTLMLVKNFMALSVDWLSFYMIFACAGSGVSLVLVVISLSYFSRRFAKQSDDGK